MKNFCPLPFGHLLVDTTGAYRVCCDHKMHSENQMSLRDSTPVEWFESSYIKEVQDAFLADQRHPGCETCWRHEDAGRLSMRQRNFKEYKILDINKPQGNGLVNVELQIGNLCNLSCIMCNEYNSSRVLAENRLLGISAIDQSKFKWTEKHWKNLETLLDQNIRVLNIRGGEPFYTPALIDLIEKIDFDHAQKMTLHITTNGTVWSDRWLELFSKFKLVRMMFSIDGIGEVFEYIRYPASWKDVETNVLKFCRLSNVKPLVNSVVQNLNINHIGDLVSWCQNNNLHLDLNRLYQPRYLEITNLLPHLSAHAQQHIKDLLSKNLSNSITKFLTSCLHELERSSYDPSLWQEFQDIMSLRESIRKNDHRRIMIY